MQQGYGGSGGCAGSVFVTRFVRVGYAGDMGLCGKIGVKRQGLNHKVVHPSSNERK